MTYLPTLGPSLIRAVLLVGSFAFIGLIFQYYLNRSARQQTTVWSSFQKRDHQANFITKREFPSFLLLTFEKDNIPYIPQLADENLYERIMSFHGKPMVDLSSYSNVELKEQFGINHFNKLVQYEECFFFFCSALYDYGVLLQKEHHIEEARQLASYAIAQEWQTDKFVSFLNT